MKIKNLFIVSTALILMACSSSDSNNDQNSELNSSKENNETNNSNGSNEDNQTENATKNINIPSCTTGAVELKSGDKINKLSENDPEVEITHSEDGNKTVCLNSGEAEIVR